MSLSRRRSGAARLRWTASTSTLSPANHENRGPDLIEPARPVARDEQGSDRHQAARPGGESQQVRAHDGGDQEDLR